MDEEYSVNDLEAIVVPEGKLFVMGDNRNDSYDSRDPSFGFVEIENVKGKPLYIYWAKDKTRIGKIVE